MAAAGNSFFCFASMRSCHCTGRYQKTMQTLIRSGCAFFAAVGKHHLQWHLAFDEANLRHSPDLEEDKTITTISREALELDSVEEWVLTSEHPLVDIEQGILLYENKSQLEIVEGFLRRAFQQAGDGINDNHSGT